MDIVLYQPEIPPNTGNIARLCAATGTKLHLIEPLGFKLEDRYLKRAGLDYWPLVDMQVWPDMHALLPTLSKRRLVTASARDGEPVHRFSFAADDVLIMGRETSGLPDWVYNLAPHRVRIPFAPDRRKEDANGLCVRSLNLSTATGIVLYFALASSGLLDSWETGQGGCVAAAEEQRTPHAL